MILRYVKLPHSGPKKKEALDVPSAVAFLPSNLPPDSPTIKANHPSQNLEDLEY
jgi:hypothetical protein